MGIWTYFQVNLGDTRVLWRKYACVCVNTHKNTYTYTILNCLIYLHNCNLKTIIQKSFTLLNINYIQPLVFFLFLIRNIWGLHKQKTPHVTENWMEEELQCMLFSQGYPSRTQVFRQKSSHSQYWFWPNSSAHPLRAKPEKTSCPILWCTWIYHLSISLFQILWRIICLRSTFFFMLQCKFKSNLVRFSSCVSVLMVALIVLYIHHKTESRIS